MQIESRQLFKLFSGKLLDTAVAFRQYTLY